MSTTINDIASWITTHQLVRTDVNALAVDSAKNFYLILCGKIPFDALQQTSAERAVSTTTTLHAISDLSPAVSGIVSIRMTYGAGQFYRMRRSSTRVFDAENQTQTTRPTRYARWGGGLEFDRLANTSTYTCRIRYWSIPTIDTTSTTTVGSTVLLTPPEWDELLKWETLYRVYTALDEHEKAAMLVQPAMMPRQASPKKTIQFEVGIIPRLWNDLLQTRDQRESPDEEYGINPRMQSYTAVR